MQCSVKWSKQPCDKLSIGIEPYVHQPAILTAHRWFHGNTESDNYRVDKQHIPENQPRSESTVNTVERQALFKVALLVWRDSTGSHPHNPVDLLRMWVVALYSGAVQSMAQWRVFLWLLPPHVLMGIQPIVAAIKAAERGQRTVIVNVGWVVIWAKGNSSHHCVSVNENQYFKTEIVTGFLVSQRLRYLLWSPTLK